MAEIGLRGKKAMMSFYNTVKQNVISSLGPLLVREANDVVLKKTQIAHRGARTHDHKVKSLALYRLS